MHTLRHGIAVAGMIIWLALPAVANTGLFTYQGFLRDGGAPAEGEYDLRFRLYDQAAEFATLLGEAVHDDVQVTASLFSVELNFGEAVWNGQERWLEIAVRPGDSTGAFTALEPRQHITAVPYAVHALKSVTASALTLPFSATVQTAVPALLINNTSTQGSGEALSVLTSVESGAAVRARATSTTGFAFGVWGTSSSGWGVFGQATGSGNYGVRGESDSGAGGYFESPHSGVVGIGGSGSGVFGSAWASSGEAYGVQGESASTSGRGVFGRATANSGTTYGVRGESNSPDGLGGYFSSRRMGVQGIATSGFVGETTTGVWGQSANSSGRGVFGVATANSGTTYGVRGESASTDGVGVFGLASSTFGSTTYGVRGESASGSGRGVFGVATSNTGLAYGVSGESVSTAGRGVYGHATATTGITQGVYGETSSTTGGTSQSGASGVLGLVSSTNPGAYSAGVRGINNSTTGLGPG
ncbi:MAG: hypothetical protein HY718_08055 [Planctomycetes bacterium]|nr:hypothetical protein [Planctomycetota bacterium]